jgi:hypothetical protein
MRAHVCPIFRPSLCCYNRQEVENTARIAGAHVLATEMAATGGAAIVRTPSQPPCARVNNAKCVIRKRISTVKLFEIHFRTIRGAKVQAKHVERQESYQGDLASPLPLGKTPAPTAKRTGTLRAAQREGGRESCSLTLISVTLRPDRTRPCRCRHS